MAVIWKLKQPLAGRFLVVDDAEAAEMVEAGEAQYANESATKAKPAEYQTREMTAEKPAKKKRKTKSKDKPESNGD